MVRGRMNDFRHFRLGDMSMANVLEGVSRGHGEWGGALFGGFSWDLVMGCDGPDWRVGSLWVPKF